MSHEHKTRLVFDMKRSDAIKALSGGNEASAIAMEDIFHGLGYPVENLRWEDVAKAIDRLALYGDKVGVLYAIHKTSEKTAAAIYNAYRAANPESRAMPERQIAAWKERQSQSSPRKKPEGPRGSLKLIKHRRPEPK